MKAFGNITILAATVLLSAVVSSCVRNESVAELGDDAPKEICFRLTPVRTGTKAATFSSFPADSAFGTCAWYLPDGKKWTTDGESSEIYVEPDKISFNPGNSVWKAWGSGKLYWWPQSGTLSFFCWAPYNLTERGLSLNNTDGIRIDGWSVINRPGYGGATDYGKGQTMYGSASDGSVDILTARSLELNGNTANVWEQADGSAFYGYGARIQFRHALCKVSFVLRLDYAPEDGKKWYVEDAVLKDIYTKASLSGSTWGDYVSSSVKDYEISFKEGENSENGLEINSTDNTVIFPKTMMIPQPLTRSTAGTYTRIPRIELTVWKEGSYKDVTYGTVTRREKDTQILTGMLYSSNADIIRWSEGTDITYHLYISTGAENYIEFDASTEDWGTGTGSEIELK